VSRENKSRQYFSAVQKRRQKDTVALVERGDITSKDSAQRHVHVSAYVTESRASR